MKSEINAEEYKKAYSEGSYLEWPADWVIRFWAYVLKKEQLAEDKVLDFGCGSGNNAAFFASKGYEVFGCDASPEAIGLTGKAFNRFSLPFNKEHFEVCDPGVVKLPYPNEFFDVIIANQSLYYLVNPGQLYAIIMELFRVCKPRGGKLFATMMSTMNSHFTHYLTGVDGNIAEITVDNKRYQSKEYIYRVKDEQHLKDIFVPFECTWTGWYDVSLPTTRSHHWIYIGNK